LARVILTQPGEDIDIGGDVTLFGTRSGGEVITVLRGTILLDPSFNAGGDTLRLPDDAAFFTVRLSGASAVIQGLGVTVTVPVGAAGIQVAFNDIARTLLFDTASSSVRLGDQVVTSAVANVVPAGGPATLVGTQGPDVITGTEGNDVIDGLDGADRIDGGAGNDILRGGAGGDDLDGSFGSGRDELVLSETALVSARFGQIVVTDLQAGSFGDTIEFLRALSVAATSWDQSSNPFASGFLRLIDREGSAVLQFDRDGPGSTLSSFRDVLVFTGVSASSLTRDNLAGFDPRVTILEAPGTDDLAVAPDHGVGMLFWEHQAFA
jgi:Ca2+-binding RTX toxin-like protein